VNSKPASARGLILLLWLAGLCAAAQFAKISVNFSALSTYYQEAGRAVGLLLTLISFFGVVFGLFAGQLITRFGTRRPVIIACFIGGLVSLFQMSLPDFPTMLASRFIEGASHLMIVVAAPSLIARLSSDAERPFMMTLWGSFFGVAFALTYWLQPYLTAVSSLFLLHGSIMLTTGVALAALLPRDEHLNPVALSAARVIRQHITAYASPFMSAAALGWLFYTLSFVSLLTIAPEIVNTEDRSWVNPLLPLAGIVSSLTLGALLLRKLSAINVVMLGFASTMLCLFAMTISPASPWPHLALFTGMGLVQGASFAAIPQMNPNPQPQALAYGALAQMGNLGNLTGTLILLAAMDTFGVPGLIGFGLACQLGGLLVHAALARKRKQVFPASPDQAI
jgi:MFS transporter, DHA1 family, inner membrane transport protein